MADFDELDWVKYKTHPRLLGMVISVNGSTLLISTHSGTVEINMDLLEKCNSKGVPVK